MMQEKIYEGEKKLHVNRNLFNNVYDLYIQFKQKQTSGTFKHKEHAENAILFLKAFFSPAQYLFSGY